MSLLSLRILSEEDEEAFFASIEEFKTDDPHWEFAFELESLENFKQYVERVNSWSRGENLKKGFVPSSYLLAVVDNAIVGRVSIRYELNEFLRQYAGHIGYGVVPSQRRKGYAKEILSQAVIFLRDKGVSDILVTCDDTNIGSIKAIESCGGIMEDKIQNSNTDILTRRYWIRE